MELVPEVLAELRAAAERARFLNHSPYSNVVILAAAYTTSGACEGASNLENENFSLTKHAEELAIFATFRAAQKQPRFQRLQFMYVAGALPCGSCRQFVHEFAAADGAWVIENVTQTELKTSSLRDLPGDRAVTVLPFADALPFPFTTVVNPENGASADGGGAKGADGGEGERGSATAGRGLPGAMLSR